MMKAAERVGKQSLLSLLVHRHPELAGPRSGNGQYGKGDCLCKPPSHNAPPIASNKAPIFAAPDAGNLGALVWTGETR